MDDEELRRLKRLDLRAYAGSLGFAIDRRRSSRASTLMRRGSEKIIVVLKPDGVYTYWSPHSDERGTIIDLVQRNHRGFTLGDVRKELRAWAILPTPALVTVLPELASSEKDINAVRERFRAMRVALRHPYLEDQRGIPASVLRSSRFAGTVRIDRHHAAIFPHHDVDGNICGFEQKNAGFSGFSAGGRKHIWLSNRRVDDARLVLCESAVDCLSHAALLNDQLARYASVAGKPTAAQHVAMRAAILAMPTNSEIVAAFDADASGRSLSDLLAKIVADCGRNDLSFRRDEPVGAKDFNEVLQKKLRACLRRHTAEPAVS